MFALIGCHGCLIHGEQPGFERVTRDGIFSLRGAPLIPAFTRAYAGFS